MHTNGTVWNDTQGKPVQAHGGGLLRVDDTWYWYGEDKSGPTYEYPKPDGGTVARVDMVGVSGYRGRDLVHWDPMGVVLAASPGVLHYDLHTTQVLERPKVVSHRASGTFVMWVHIDRPDYKLAAAGVAVADRPEGPVPLPRLDPSTGARQPRPDGLCR